MIEIPYPIKNEPVCKGGVSIGFIAGYIEPYITLKSPGMHEPSNVLFTVRMQTIGTENIKQYQVFIWYRRPDSIDQSFNIRGRWELFEIIQPMAI